jgi:hypothetical protein
MFGERLRVVCDEGRQTEMHAETGSEDQFDSHVPGSTVIVDGAVGSVVAGAALM